MQVLKGLRSIIYCIILGRCELELVLAGIKKISTSYGTRKNHAVLLIKCVGIRTRDLKGRQQNFKKSSP